MERREALRVIGMGGGGIMAGAAFTAPACPGGKNLSTYVLIITKSYAEIQTLLPDLGLGQGVIDRISDLAAQAIKVAEQFDAAYKSGAFENASAFFNQLGTLSQNIANDLHVTNSRIVKGVLAGIGIARITISALLAAQANQLPPARTARLSPEAQKAKAEMEKLNRVDLDAILRSVQ